MSAPLIVNLGRLEVGCARAQFNRQLLLFATKRVYEIGMTEIATLEDAVSIAALAHRGQKDRAGAPYLLHPLRMMLQMKSDAAMMAAILHGRS